MKINWKYSRQTNTEAQESKNKSHDRYHVNTPWSFNSVEDMTRNILISENQQKNSKQRQIKHTLKLILHEKTSVELRSRAIFISLLRREAKLNSVQHFLTSSIDG